MKKLKNFIITTFIIIFLNINIFAQFSPNIDSKNYIPSRINSSLFQKSGQFDISISIGSSGIEPQFAISPAKNLAFFVNAGISDSYNIPKDHYKHKHFLYDIGAGYYIIRNKIIIFDIYTGYGRGTSLSKSDYFDVTSLYNRFFIQPGFGIISKKAEFSICLRMGRLEEHVYGIYGHNWLYIYESTEWIIERKINFKFGSPKFKVTIQAGISQNIKTFSFSHNYPEHNHSPWFFSVGIQYKFNYIGN